MTLDVFLNPSEFGFSHLKNGFNGCLSSLRHRVNERLKGDNICKLSEKWRAIQRGDDYFDYDCMFLITGVMSSL